LNHNDKYWDDPYSFNPDRFDSPYDTYAFHQFGLGPRRCLGYRFAESLIKTLVVQVLQHNSLSVAPGQPQPVAQETGLPFFSAFASFPKITFTSRRLSPDDKVRIFRVTCNTRN
jgi:cytochrome P450